MAYRHTRRSRGPVRSIIAICIMLALLALAYGILRYAKVYKHRAMKHAVRDNTTTKDGPYYGVGVWIYDFKQAEGGDPKKITEKAVEIGLIHLIVCTDRGGQPFNDHGKIKELVKLCNQKGILVIGYERCYRKNTDAETRAAANSIVECNLDGFIMDMEGEFTSQPDAATAIIRPMRLWIDKHIIDPKSFVFGCSCYGIRSLHADFPWKEVENGCDYLFPQWYTSAWQKSMKWDINTCLDQIETDQESYGIPFIPTVQAYGKGCPDSIKPEDLAITLWSIDTTYGVNIFRWELMDDDQWKVVKAFARSQYGGKKVFEEEK